jgi:hypothetical protein
MPLAREMEPSQGAGKGAMNRWQMHQRYVAKHLQHADAARPHAGDFMLRRARAVARWVRQSGGERFARLLSGRDPEAPEAADLPQAPR